MTSIEIHIDEPNSAFILRGNLELVLNNRRAQHYLFRSLHALLHDDHIAVSYSNKDRERLLNQIRQALSKYNIPVLDSEEVQEVLHSYYQDQRDFSEFSEKARGIWHNEVEVEEFQEFSKILLNSWPERRLYDKQLLAAFHLAFAQNACNFSVPGSGKTSVVYGAFAYLNNLVKEHPKHVNRLLIIGPLSCFGPWEKEYKKCFGFEVSSKRLSGGVDPNERERYLLSIQPEAEVPLITLMSYQSIQFNLQNLMHFLNREDLKFMIVLDEAHRIKNVSGGMWATSVLNLATYGSSRVVLTGTPAPNGYEDIFNLYRFIWPTHEIIDYTISHLREMTQNPYDPRIDQLIHNISPFYIRIRKSDLDLPRLDEHDPVLVPMSELQREIYDHLEKSYMSYFNSHINSSGLEAQLIRARLIRLMQIAANPALLRKPIEQYFQAEYFAHNETITEDSDIIDKILRYADLEKWPNKYHAIGDLVEEILSQDEKVLIWGVFIHSIKGLQEYLYDRGIQSELLIGEVPVESDSIAEEVRTREKIIDEFHDTACPYKVLIANPFAVGESISLHMACHHAIYFERTFNAANYIQSKDRIHRVGLPENVVTHYHYIITDKSIETTIHERLQQKETRMLELIESQEIPLISENLNYDVDLDSDLKAVIRDYVRRTVTS